MKTVEMFYLRSNNDERFITIDLLDVRAANSITITYDFERDGWSILSDCANPDIPEQHLEDLTEVAFVPAWKDADWLASGDTSESNWMSETTAAALGLTAGQEGEGHE